MNIYNPYPPIQNKYYKWYMNICSSRQQERGYYTKKITPQHLTGHHIDPKCFYIKHKTDGWKSGNPDTKDNITFLTDKEHVLCHKLLLKCYNGLAKRKMSYAFSMMNNERNLTHNKNLLVSISRENNIGENNPMFGKEPWNKGIKRPDISIMMTGSGNPMFGRKQPKTKAQKENCRIQATGRKYVTNGIVNLRVKPEQVEFYLSQGYIQGATKQIH